MKSNTRRIEEGDSFLFYVQGEITYKDVRGRYTKRVENLSGLQFRETTIQHNQPMLAAGVLIHKKFGPGSIACQSAHYYQAVVTIFRQGEEHRGENPKERYDVCHFRLTFDKDEHTIPVTAEITESALPEEARAVLRQSQMTADRQFTDLSSKMLRLQVHVNTLADRLMHGPKEQNISPDGLICINGQLEIIAENVREMMRVATALKIEQNLVTALEKLDAEPKRQGS